MFEMMTTVASGMLAEVNITLTDKCMGLLGGLLGCGMIVIGAATGIGNVAGHATEAIARQPEAGGRIFTTMIIAAALIEGVTLFSLIICLMAIL